MAQLRSKLEPDPSRPAYFRTEPGMGYRFDPVSGDGLMLLGIQSDGAPGWPRSRP